MLAWLPATPARPVNPIPSSHTCTRRALPTQLIGLSRCPVRSIDPMNFHNVVCASDFSNLLLNLGTAFRKLGAQHKLSCIADLHDITDDLNPSTKQNVNVCRALVCLGHTTLWQACVALETSSWGSHCPP